MRRRRLTRIIALHLTITIAIIAIVAGVAARVFLHASPRMAIGFGAALFLLGIATMSLTMRRPFRRIRRNLSALVDGVRGFSDGDFSLRLHVTGGDEITDLVAVYNDIGDILREQRNESVQRELLFETVLQASPLAMILTSDHGRIVFVNRAARDLFGGRERVEGRKFDDLAADVPALRDALQAGPSAIFTADGETFQLTRRSFYLNTREHTLYLIARLTQDLRRQELDIWKRAIRVVNHELNNSLAPIHSLFHSATVVQSRADDDGRLSEINAAIEERLTSLQQFIDGYANLARLPKPRRENVRWAEVIEAVRRITPFAAEEPAHNASIDRAQIEQVLINLVKNARESGSAEADIVVRVNRRDGGSALVVEDRGEGMDDETLGHALLPFYSTKPGGTGLGLAVAGEIVDAHGGHVRIARRDGGGITVTCWIPDA
ncbi:MAG: two-component system, NtrC family, nitrogen regulation sensor histidine kinase NtrY [Thermoanaerobaculia bacterium]|nr:two-component system, NtrC family, nitrogen regulation sensor histidine kinase NtrY [Thermoanaerobaculia bacterium]